MRSTIELINKILRNCLIVSNKFIINCLHCFLDVRLFTLDATSVGHNTEGLFQS